MRMYNEIPTYKLIFNVPTKRNLFIVYVFEILNNLIKYEMVTKYYKKKIGHALITIIISKS